MRLVLVGILLIGFFPGFGQSSQGKVLDQEITLRIDNDVFTSPLLDQYYSSGIYINYRQQRDTSRLGPHLVNVINHFGFSQRIYTANAVEEAVIAEMDRPYAGLLSLNAGQSLFFKKRHALELRFELGWMGPANFTGEIHRAWHQFFGLPEINGWDTQISNALHVNGYVRHGMQLLRGKDRDFQLDALLESEIALGSVFNSWQEHLVLRLGRSLPVNISGFLGNTLGPSRPKGEHGAVEAYIMYSPGFQYTLYNGTLQGGLLSLNESLFTKDPTPWVYHQKFGLLLRYRSFDFNFIVHLHKPETDGVTSHQYAGIELKQRF